MNTAEFQSQIIDKLDKVVAGAEALMMDERSRTLADFARLKSEIQSLLEVVTAFERLCHGESGLQSVKQTIAALKRSVETERASMEAGASGGDAAGNSVRPVVSDGMADGKDDAAADEDDGLSFGFEVLPDAGENAEAMADNRGADRPAEKPKSIEPELGLMFDDEPEPASGPEAEAATEGDAAEPAAAPMAEPVAGTAADPAVAPKADSVVETAAEPTVAEPAPEAVRQVEETAPETLVEPAAPAPAAAPEPVSSADAIFEAIKQENLAQFSVKEEDQPQSYITQLTAMVQAQVKPGEQDMSGVAVSSTARPDVTPASSGDSLMESLRSTRANLHGGQLRTMVDKFKAPQTIYDIQHTRTIDLKMTIGVNEKYLLTQELFGGNVKEYTEAVGRLNDAADTAAASAVWQALSAQRGWDENSLAYVTFYDLLKRRFPDLA